ncbi:MAG: hypothetical protein IJY22_05245 [Clostridia bacterium]|nr:hypothetical protein [Clostridia bacterium]
MQNAVTPPAGGTGYLVVQVTTAGNAIPLEGAAVTVRQGEGEGKVLYELRSGRDGRTDRMSLPAPPRAESQRPSVNRPYAVYSIEVVLPQYERAFYQNVPVFDGITAIQQANLVPVPENGYPDGFTLNGGQSFGGLEHQLRGGND